MAKKHSKKVATEVSVENGVATGDSSPHIHQRDKIGFQLSIRERDDLTEKQKRLIDLILDKNTRVVFVNGPAGTSKTWVAIYCALHLLKKRAVSDLLYVRSLAESASKSFGTLPGDLGPKLQPFLMPLQDKLDELLPRGEVDKLLKDERATGMPINFLRGSSFNAKVIIADEAQNFDFKELTTLITRLGQFSKMLIIGDSRQSDLHGRSGFTQFYQTFDDDDSRQRGIHCFSFTKEDIVRSGILGYIVDRIESANQSPSKPV
jgi:phosphate starvation-inducible PhoH-like protein